MFRSCPSAINGGGVRPLTASLIEGFEDRPPAIAGFGRGPNGAIGSDEPEAINIYND